MLDIPPAETALGGVAMELVDAAYPLVKGIVATVDVDEACKDVDVAVMVGGFPRGPGMERKEVMGKNVSIYKGQASALEKHAAPDCKVVVVANPANTNALILSNYAPKIPKENVTCLTRLDHNRALGQVAPGRAVSRSDGQELVIWGNHSSTQYPDVNHGRVGETPIREVCDDAYLTGSSSPWCRRAAPPSSRRGSSPPRSPRRPPCATTRAIGSTAPRRARGRPWASSARAATRRTASRPG